MRRALAIAAAAGLAASVATAEAAAPRKGARYAGMTEQDHAVSFRVTRSGRAIRGFRVRFDVVCTSGSLFSARNVRFRQTTGFMKVHRDGTFSGNVRVRPEEGSDVRSGRFTVNGRFVRRGRVARGAFRERLRLTDGLACDSGELAFSARVARRR